MKSEYIGIKTIDYLFEKINKMAYSLSCDWDQSGIGSFDIEDMYYCLESKKYTTFVNEFFDNSISKIKEGIEYKRICSLISDNINVRGEDLYLSSTKLNSENLLIEMYKESCEGIEYAHYSFIVKLD